MRFFKKILTGNNASCFQISIDDSGAAVVVYLKNGFVVNRLYLKSASIPNAKKLIQLLRNDTTSDIKIYLNLGAQTYRQEYITALNNISAKILARSKLKTSKSSLRACLYLKNCLLSGGDSSITKKWAFTFAEVADGHNRLDEWLALLLPYPNIVRGIHLLPIELGSVVTLLGGAKNLSEYEVVIFHCKSGSFRRTTFYQGRIINSNLIANAHDSNYDIVAGNIEQEINDATSNLNKLGLGTDKENISITIIASSNILQYIRQDKIGVGKALLLTSHRAAQILNVEAVSTPKDKYFEHILLAYLGKISKSIIRLHSPQTHKVYCLTNWVNLAKNIAYILSAIIVLIAIFGFVQSSELRLDDRLTQDKIKIFTNKAKIADDRLKLIHLRFQGTTLPAKAGEIASYDAFIAQSLRSPNDVLSKLSQVFLDEPNIKVIDFKWHYLSPNTDFYKIPFTTKLIDVAKGGKQSSTVVVKMAVAISPLPERTGYGTLESLYTKIKELIETKFVGAEVILRPLPDQKSISTDQLVLHIEIKDKSKQGEKYVN